VPGVTPRISGNRVTLEIEVRQDQPSGDTPEVVRTQQIQTQIQARLDEWIDIGSILGASNRQDAGLINRSSSQQSGQRHVVVKGEGPSVNRSIHQKMTHGGQ
jgi:hypothetical protein